MFLFIKNLLFTVFVPGVVAGYVPWRLVAGSASTASPSVVARSLAAIAFACGAAIYFWCLYDFAFSGRGTPAPIDPPTRLVVRGLYRYMRNPMYVGVVLVIAGWAILFRASNLLVYGATVAILMHSFVYLVEEPMLRRRFGDAYEDYCRQVSRWIPHRPASRVA